MNEYAVRVFSLVNEALKLNAIKRLDDIAVTSIPYMEKTDARQTIDNFVRQAQDEVIDLDEPDKDRHEKLKQIFGE